ncbi:MAG: 3-hydroxyacyl-CoA dehydrogenase [Acidobacteria bacterium]|nr:3-hydroxyacyl-CoA dehydrogenase [Acidobacteriota bacterium]
MTAGRTTRSIQSVAVLGAGTMGAQLAAHMANAGLPTLLLDLDRDTACAGLERIARLRPAPHFSETSAQRIAVGGFDTEADQLAGVDWIIEAIVERLDAKRALLERIEAHRRSGTIVSSNTSGLSIDAIAQGRSEEFRAHWLGTHFFNPPRYLPLMELVPTAHTDGQVVALVRRFADVRLGKGVVIARDTPNFIANRIGLFGAARALDALADGYTIEEIDAMTGPAIGRPKSATFRTIDLSGIDVLAEVARNLRQQFADDEAERRAFELPSLVDALVDSGALGEKTGRGFYQKTRAAGRSEILTLDPGTREYRARRAPTLAALDASQGIADLRTRIRTLFLGDDRVGEFLRRTLGATLVYAARVAPDIAESIDDVDRAMRWGYGWELGPFEMLDAIGPARVMDACGETAPPPLVAELLSRGDTTAATFRSGNLPPADPELLILSSARDRTQVVKSNSGASLVDIGDGVLALEFHSKLNVIGSDTIDMTRLAAAEAAARFEALVVGNDGRDFSAGANLLLLLMEAEEGNWDEVDLMVRSFQAATIGLQRAPVPVVAAPAGLTLGGGCEVVLHADTVQAAAECYVGLVETGVGLIPAGGGTKEMVARASAATTLEDAADPTVASRQVFETIGLAAVSTSAPDAVRLGYLAERDGITMNRERLLADAKRRGLDMVRAGYQPAAPRRVKVGGEGVGAALKLGVHLAHRAGQISAHDARIGRALAGIVSGGPLPHPTEVSEDYLLDLEREAFLSLCGEAKTLDRIRHTLKTGKTLRN